jgi:hypothetical protein
MIHPRQMQQPMQQQNPYLIPQRMSMLDRLPSSRLQRNRQIPSMTPTKPHSRRKAQHIRSLIFPAKLPIQPPQRSIPSQQHLNLAAQPHCRLRGRQVAAKPRPGQPPLAPHSCTVVHSSRRFNREHDVPDAIAPQPPQPIDLQPPTFASGCPTQNGAPNQGCPTATLSKP